MIPRNSDQIDEMMQRILTPSSGDGGDVGGGGGELDFFGALVLCLTSSLAPPSPDGHGQHWSADEAFIPPKSEQVGRGRVVCPQGRDIVAQSVVQRGTMAHVALDSTTPPWNPYVCVIEKGGFEGLDVRGCVGQTQRIRTSDHIRDQVTRRVEPG